ncbi:MAG TPA: DUF3592 domain-containing protein [Verrucomicrobiae bacterium]|nr:DUF3592 domain-containing protein [Verrucomicrobiae bacterium]
MNLTMPVVSQPPRVVPLSTRITLLFGNALAKFGWIFFAFGMVVVWVFAGYADWSGLFLFHGKLETAPAFITSREKTSFSEGGNKQHRGTPIFAYHYQFQRDGKNYTGISYQLGASRSEGESVLVEFPAGKPTDSRIRGMRRAPFSLVVSFVFIFPTIGLALALTGFWSGWKNMSLLANGQIAQGRLISKAATNIQVNSRTVFKLTFEFLDPGGQTQQAVAKTERPERLENNVFEPIFYDPQNPGRAVLLDGLPGKHGFSEHGELRPAGFWRATFALVRLFLAFLSIVLGAYIKFR